MTDQIIKLCHLCFVGPTKEASSIEFGDGLNIIYGASDTGKSFILEVLDFMLGAGGDLRDIPERVGYDRIFLGLEFSNDGHFTLERSTSGGDFRCYEGLHKCSPKDIKAEILKTKHAATKKNTVSAFILEKIGLWDKRVRKNAKGQTNSLSFRHLSSLALINETDIQKRTSPILSGQFTTKTVEMSVFKLLLTGIDDSALEPEVNDEKIVVSRAAKIEIIDELLEDFKFRLEDLIGDDSKEDIQEQLEKLNKTIDERESSLRRTEEEYNELIENQNKVRVSINSIENRKKEIDEMLVRFKLLNEHYESDIARLDGVEEAGSLIAALEPGRCPLCGAEAADQHVDQICDGNLDNVVTAAISEKLKIKKLKSELKDTVNSLKKERGKHKDDLPALDQSLKSLAREIKLLSPDLSNIRGAYSEFVEKKNGVQQALSLFDSISELEEKREAIDGAPTESSKKGAAVSDLSESTLNDFSILMESILNAWKFPESNRVHFDKEQFDLVISGKPRGSRGKGMRAITHAAFTVGIMKYAEECELPHPGFIVLDTPLLAYREPEGKDDDLSGTDVHEKFYEYLLKWNSRQTIVLENETPPEIVINKKQTKFFSKNPNKGRYGLFPNIGG